MKLINIVKKDTYYDSISLMLISKNISHEEGVVDASIMMGTEENLKLLKSATLLKEDTEAGPNDIVIAIKGDAAKVDRIADEIDIYFKNIRVKEKESRPEDIEQGLNILPDANLTLISVSGRYASAVAEEALKNNLNVKIFSDNVPIEEEIKLKKIGVEKNLFVLGPDAGTSIINGIPLAFANVVNRGNIGIVGASGTGIQETSVIISKNKAGISQALGIGSRDLSREVGGIMAKFCLQALDENDDTKVILFISKPPAETVAQDLLNFIENNIEKEVVIIFLGQQKEFFKNYKKVIPASTLFEAAMISVYLSQQKSVKDVDKLIASIKSDIKQKATRFKCKGKYIRGLFSGGTLCEEAMSIILPVVGDEIYSNVPIKEEFRLKDVFKSKAHTFIDMGSDEFTRGRPHPMIDYEFRTRRLVEEAKDPDVGVILMDIVLGYGAHNDPSAEVVPAIEKAKKINKDIIFISYILGTDKDVQNYSYQKERLKNAGMVIADSNFEASLLAAEIIHQ